MTFSPGRGSRNRKKVSNLGLAHFCLNVANILSFANATWSTLNYWFWTWPNWLSYIFLRFKIYMAFCCNYFFLIPVAFNISFLTCINSTFRSLTFFCKTSVLSPSLEDVSVRVGAFGLGYSSTFFSFFLPAPKSLFILININY